MEVQSIGSRNDNLGRILVDPLPEIFHNRGIAGGARIGRGMTKLSWFMPMLLAFCLPVRQGGNDDGMEGRKSQWEVNPFRERMRRQRNRLPASLDRIGAPLVTLRAVGNPFFRFSFAGGAKEGEVGSPA